MNKFSKNDQRGIAHLLLVVVVAAVVGVAVFAGMKVVTSNKDSAAKNSSTGVVADKAVADACNKQLHDKDLCKFASNYKLDGLSYEMVMSGTQERQPTTMTFKIDGKGNSDTIIKEAGKETSDFIYLNKTTYTKDLASGTWIKYPDAADNTTPTETKPSDDIGINANDLTENNTTSYKSLGKEACGSLTCFKYQVIDTKNASTTTYIWFGTKDYALHRVFTKDSTGTNDITITYKAINIKEPSPVHDYSGDAAGAAAAQAAANGAATDYTDYGTNNSEE